MLETFNMQITECAPMKAAMIARSSAMYKNSLRPLKVNGGLNFSLYDERRDATPSMKVDETLPKAFPSKEIITSS